MYLTYIYVAMLLQTLFFSVYDYIFMLQKRHLITLFFKKPVVYAIFNRLGTDYSLSCCIVFTFVGSLKKT